MPKRKTRREGDEVLTPKRLKSFWERVAKGTTEECWIWKGSLGRKGYGRFTMGLWAELAHRISYRIKHGSIPHDLFVCHTCDNPAVRESCTSLRRD